uniref:Putative secreted protein n=1 Tax=Anopheles marajoara TaxID=58244 RepID=A0A2M4CE99_9DIPT
MTITERVLLLQETIWFVLGWHSEVSCEFEVRVQNLKRKPSDRLPCVNSYFLPAAPTAWDCDVKFCSSIEC